MTDLVEGAVAMVKSIRLLALGLIVVTAGACTVAKNTSAQDLAWERWEKCKQSGVNLRRIEPNGRIWVTYAADHGLALREFQECDRSAIADQRSRAATPPPTTIVAPVGRDPYVAGPAMAPLWQPGDEWSYRWENPRGKGSFVWKVDRVETVDGVDYYVVKSGPRREIYWRRADLVYFQDKVDGAVEVRQVPLIAWTLWPLTPGRTWTMHYREERPADGQAVEYKRACRVDGAEVMTVPAGEFKTMKVTCTDMATNQLTSEFWYAPSLKNRVMERSHFSDGVRQRELTGYRVE